MQKSISLDDMPPTFRDAVIVTRRLGHRYLWIDSLCILQDSRQDWAEESVRMGDYYKYSILTIAVDIASGDHEGFLTTPRQHEKPVKIRVPGETSHKVFVVEKDPTTVLKWDTPLGRRAWALQEDLMSPRTLHYTLDQLVWQCQRQTYCESDVNALAASKT
jgi:hypothetical protein